MGCASSAQRCAEAGASKHQLMSLFGGSYPQRAAVYTKKADRARLEASAAPPLVARRSNKSVHFFLRCRFLGWEAVPAVPRPVTEKPRCDGNL